MMNEVCLVGRIVSIPSLDYTYDKMIYIPISLKIARPIKNSEGQYCFDIITVQVRRGDAIRILDLCQDNDLIGVKGRIENRDNHYVVIAEKVNFA